MDFTTGKLSLDLRHHNPINGPLDLEIQEVEQIRRVSGDNLGTLFNISP